MVKQVIDPDIGLTFSPSWKGSDFWGSRSIDHVTKFLTSILKYPIYKTAIDHHQNHTKVVK